VSDADHKQATDYYELLEITLEYLYDHIWIVGDADEVEAKLKRLYADIGKFGTLLLMGHEWQPRASWERSMRLFAERVAPRLAEQSLTAA
jgi:alkanesulfonate monooxygenase SsuD/methylene tetrahydromethanopterin reductase-like flavin-dependent oxidoreductase (luciferase family)